MKFAMLTVMWDIKHPQLYFPLSWVLDHCLLVRKQILVQQTTSCLSCCWLRE